MSEDDNKVMEAALKAGRAVYQADLRDNLGVSLLDTFIYSLGEKEGDLSRAIAEFHEAVRLDSNNSLAQHHLSLALSYSDHPARPEEGKFFPGPLPGSREFEESNGFVPVGPIPVWPAVDQSIRKVYREQAGREPTEQELAVLKQRITGTSSADDGIAGSGL